MIDEWSIFFFNTWWFQTVYTYGLILLFKIAIKICYDLHGMGEDCWFGCWNTAWGGGSDAVTYRSVIVTLRSFTLSLVLCETEKMSQSLILKELKNFLIKTGKNVIAKNFNSLSHFKQSRWPYFFFEEWKILLEDFKYFFSIPLHFISFFYFVFFCFVILLLK